MNIKYTGTEVSFQKCEGCEGFEQGYSQYSQYIFEIRMTRHNHTLAAMENLSQSVARLWLEDMWRGEPRMLLESLLLLSVLCGLLAVDCPLHCPPVSSPVCGSGEHKTQRASQLTVVLRWPKLWECLQAPPVVVSHWTKCPAQTRRQVWSPGAVSTLLSPARRDAILRGQPRHLPQVRRSPGSSLSHQLITFQYVSRTGRHLPRAGPELREGRRLRASPISHSESFEHWDHSLLGWVGPISRRPGLFCPYAFYFLTDTQRTLTRYAELRLMPDHILTSQHPLSN